MLEINKRKSTCIVFVRITKELLEGMNRKRRAPNESKRKNVKLESS